MKLRGIDFGPVFGASGVQGFFGEGYWFHRHFYHFGLNFDGCTFVAKTTTLFPQKGNMPMKEDGITPREFFPKCVKVYPLKAVVLNAVGLSGPGAEILFKDGRWQKRTEPFFLSFMSVGETQSKRLLELGIFVEMLKAELTNFRASIGLQINYSCPNVGLDLTELINEVKQGLEIASALDIPLMPKFNVALPVYTAKEISDDSNCDALCVSNTIPWGYFSDRINWHRLFGTYRSPLAHFGGGGLSGKPLLPLVVDWVRDVRQTGVKIPINAGGGILSPKDADILYETGASSIFVGSVAMLRPWRVQKIIQRAHELFGKEN